jgi:hypothetical protein
VAINYDYVELFYATLFDQLSDRSDVSPFDVHRNVMNFDIIADNAPDPLKPIRILFDGKYECRALGPPQRGLATPKFQYIFSFEASLLQKINRWICVPRHRFARLRAGRLLQTAAPVARDDAKPNRS